MKITGSRSYIKFDLENGYVLKAKGEMLVSRTFVVYKNTMKEWEPPHENEIITEAQILDIIEQVKQIINGNTVQLIFE